METTEIGEETKKKKRQELSNYWTVSATLYTRIWKTENVCPTIFKESFQRNNKLVKGGSLTMEFEEGDH
ncbi:hypothetical protein BACCIP111895_01961 [Neobacillus rhizosphaerae]|uniref:Uncharacterized protein n=1 Tax=Neobacillus rhizosphaerae TaxID=2880965 RepID=A0ABM9EQ84_9BACI|nr:hypothetical protein BACCIP111895_01961 [Neobacillus rhizosphaerae]